MTWLIFLIEIRKLPINHFQIVLQEQIIFLELGPLARIENKDMKIEQKYQKIQSLLLKLIGKLVD